MRKHCFVLVSCMILLAASSCKKQAETPAPPVMVNPSENSGPEQGKVLHYNFNGNLSDQSGQMLHAGADSPFSFTADRFGRSGMAVLLGDSGIVVTPSLYDQQIGFPFSVSLWFNAPQVDSLQTIIQADAISASSTAADYLSYNGFYLQLGAPASQPSPGRLAFSYGNNFCACPQGRTTVYVANAVTPGDWYHVVVNVSGPGENMEVFINGVKQTSPQFEVGNNSPDNRMTWHSAGSGIVGPWGYIGANANPQYNYQKFNGRVDEYRIYKRVLSQQDVNLLYNYLP